MSLIFSVPTTQRVELINIDHLVQRYIQEAEVRNAHLLLFVPHTTAAVTINENADPDVGHDLIRILNALIPFENHYRHLEGNSAAHMKSTLVGVETTIIIAGGVPQLGTWQSVFFCEFDGPRRRSIHMSHTSL